MSNNTQYTLRRAEAFKKIEQARFRIDKHFDSIDLETGGVYSRRGVVYSSYLTYSSSDSEDRVLVNHSMSILGIPSVRSSISIDYTRQKKENPWSTHFPAEYRLLEVYLGTLEEVYKAINEYNEEAYRVNDIPDRARYRRQIITSYHRYIDKVKKVIENTFEVECYRKKEVLYIKSSHTGTFLSVSPGETLHIGAPAVDKYIYLRCMSRKFNIDTLPTVAAENDAFIIDI